MTYVDDDDLDDMEAGDCEDLRKDEAGRCDKCGLAVKSREATQCHMCSAVYHRWCAGTECIVCKTPFEAKAEAKPAAKARKKTRA